MSPVDISDTHEYFTSIPALGQPLVNVLRESSIESLVKLAGVTDDEVVLFINTGFRLIQIPLENAERIMEVMKNRHFEN